MWIEIICYILGSVPQQVRDLLLSHPFQTFLWRKVSKGDLLLSSLGNIQPVCTCNTRWGISPESQQTLLVHVWTKWRYLSAAVKCSEACRGVIAAVSPSLLNQGGFWCCFSEQGFVFELIVYLGDVLDRACYIHLFFLCVLFLSDCDWVKWALWKKKEMFHRLSATEYPRQRELQRFQWEEGRRIYGEGHKGLWASRSGRETEKSRQQVPAHRKDREKLTEG